MGPVFKECELSQTPDTLMRSFFTNIEAEKICEDFLLNSNNPFQTKSVISNLYRVQCKHINSITP